MRIFRFLLLSLAIVLGGCATRPSLIKPTDDIDPTKGFLLTSMTIERNNLVMDSWFFYRKEGADEASRIDAFGLAGLLIKPNDFGAESASIGRLIAVPLEPGEYELVTWNLYVTRAGGYAYLSPKTLPPPHTFIINSGEITYLGGLHIDPIMGRNMFGLPLVVGGNPDIQNQSERDFLLLEEKYPNLRDLPINESIPDGRQWRIN